MLYATSLCYTEQVASDGRSRPWSPPTRP